VTSVLTGPSLMAVIFPANELRALIFIGVGFSSTLRMPRSVAFTYYSGLI
jgi:hypothetical protein